KELLKTFQYASDALGQFIGRVKVSDKLKDNTVIAVTGDHRMRYSSTDEPTEYGLSFAVPLFLDVPQPILDHTPFTYDPQRIGSHRDLFPTLYHFSLSNQDYISLGGENLLAQGGVSNIGFNAVRTISEQGAFSNSGSGLFYAWDEHNLLLNQARPEKSPPQETDWGKEYSLLQDYYLRSQVLPMTP
ncbi:LTA synthase family protein, partial [Vibrio furnissii]